MDLSRECLLRLVLHSHLFEPAQIPFQIECRHTLLPFSPNGHSSKPLGVSRR